MLFLFLFLIRNTKRLTLVDIKLNIESYSIYSNYIDWGECDQRPPS